MENGLDLLGVALMAAITFPLSFLIARFCLKGVLRVVTASEQNSLRPAR